MSDDRQELVIPEDLPLKDQHCSYHEAWMPARMYRALESSNRELREQVKRLSAPVSDEEFGKYATHLWDCDRKRGYAMMRNDIDTLLATRGQEPKG